MGTPSHAIDASGWFGWYADRSACWMASLAGKTAFNLHVGHDSSDVERSTRSRGARLGCVNGGVGIFITAGHLLFFVAAQQRQKWYITR